MSKPSSLSTRATILLCLLPLVAACTAEDNEQIVLDMTEAINARNLDALDDLVAPGVQRHSGATPGLVIENLAQFKAFLEADFASVPDSLQTVNVILSEGDKVAVHVTYEGTQLGDFGPFPPTGKRMKIPFIGILRIENGLIAEIWVEWDNLNALTQLGHFPPAQMEDPGSTDTEE